MVLNNTTNSTHVSTLVCVELALVTHMSWLLAPHICHIFWIMIPWASASFPWWGLIWWVNRLCWINDEHKNTKKTISIGVWEGAIQPHQFGLLKIFQPVTKIWVDAVCCINFSTVLLSNQSVNHYQSFVVTRCRSFVQKCTKFNFGWDSAPDPTGGAYSP